MEETKKYDSHENGLPRPTNASDSPLATSFSYPTTANTPLLLHDAASSTSTNNIKFAETDLTGIAFLIFLALASSYLQTTFVYNAEKDLIKSNEYKLPEYSFLVIVFVGYSFVNSEFAANVIRRVKALRQPPKLGENLDNTALYSVLDKILPLTEFKIKYRLTIPVRIFFVLFEFVLSGFAVILNVASFYVIFNTKDMAPWEKDCLLGLGAFLCLPFVGLNLIPTEAASNFLMGLMTRTEEDPLQPSHCCWKQLWEQLPTKKQATLFFVAGIINAMHALQAFEYSNILSEGDFPAAFAKIIRQRELVAIVNFAFLWATKQEKTQRLIAGLSRDKISAQMREPKAWLSLFFGLCMSSKAGLPSWSTYWKGINPPDQSYGGYILVGILALGSMAAPAAFYTMTFYDVIMNLAKKREHHNNAETLTSTNNYRALCGRFSDHLAVKGELSRPIVMKIQAFLLAISASPSIADTDLIQIIAILYRVIQSKGGDIRPNGDPEAIRAILTNDDQNNIAPSLITQFNNYWPDLRKATSYDNAYHCLLSILVCCIYSSISSAAYFGLILDSVETEGAVETMSAIVIALITIGIYLLAHQRIAYRVTEILNRFRETTSNIVVFHYDSMAAGTIHSIGAVITPMILFGKLCGIVAFISSIPSIKQEGHSRLIRYVFGSISCLISPYLCLALYLKLTNGPTKHFRTLLMGLSPKWVAMMFCSSSGNDHSPRGIDHVSQLLAVIDMLYVICLAWKELNANEDILPWLFFTALFIATYVMSMSSRTMEIVLSFKAWYRSSSRPSSPNTVLDIEHGSVGGHLSLEGILTSANTGTACNHSGNPLPPVTPPRDSTLRSEGHCCIPNCIPSIRDVSDLLAGLIMSIYVLRHLLNAETPLRSPQLLGPSVILSFFQFVGRSIMEGKGPIGKERRLVDAIGTPPTRTARISRTPSPTEYLP
jgi:hypothetical protein